jgi:uncharacterized protein (DUF302 family)
MDYGITIRTPVPFAEAVARVREALKAQGFGVLTEIDVQATLRDKLGQDMENYLILGACNPPLAHRALDADRRIGLLLPCNAVVRTVGGQTVIEALNPQIMAEVTGQPSLKPVADEATSRIRAALDSLKDSGLASTLSTRNGSRPLCRALTILAAAPVSAVWPCLRWALRSVRGRLYLAGARRLLRSEVFGPWAGGAFPAASGGDDGGA